jgi:hypothetical protein
MGIVDRSVLEGERILPAKATDAEQTNMQPQDETDETVQCFKIIDLTNVNFIESVVEVS